MQSASSLWESCESGGIPSESTATSSITAVSRAEMLRLTGALGPRPALALLRDGAPATMDSWAAGHWRGEILEPTEQRAAGWRHGHNPRMPRRLASSLEYLHPQIRLGPKLSSPVTQVQLAFCRLLGWELDDVRLDSAHQGGVRLQIPLFIRHRTAKTHEATTPLQSIGDTAAWTSHDYTAAE